MSLSTNKLLLETGGDLGYIQIQDYYKDIRTLQKSNDNVSIRIHTYVDENGTTRKQLRVQAKNEGNTVIKLADYEGSEGNVKYVNVDVVGKVVEEEDGLDEGGEELKYEYLYFTEGIETDGIGGIRFKIIGKTDEVGIEYKLLDGTEENIVLDNQYDGLYVVAFSKESCLGGCNDFRPYFRIGNEKRYYKNELKVIYDYVKDIESEDGVEINSYSSNQFSYYLKFIWFNKGYDSAYKQSKQKISDVKKEYGEEASIVISLFPGVGEGFDVWTLTKGKDPITGEVLSEFGKVITVAGLLSGAGSGKVARNLVNSGLEKLAKKLGMSIDEIIKVAKEVASEYKITSLDDIVKIKDKLSVDKFLQKVKIKAWKIKADKIISGLKYDKIRTIEKNSGLMQYIDRGWTENSIEEIIRNPKKIGKSIDYFSNPISGDCASVFYNSYHEYVIVNDKTGLIVQVSKISDLNWKQDSRIYNLIDL